MGSGSDGSLYTVRIRKAEGLMLGKDERRRANDQGGGPVFVRRFYLIFGMARRELARIGASIS
jgi:hypothetical protein